MLKMSVGHCVDFLLPLNNFKYYLKGPVFDNVFIFIKNTVPDL